MPRLLSLDVFRGLTITLMIIVNSPGLAVAYPCLMHATWDGCTFADLVFPFFIIIVGTSSVFTITYSSLNHNQLIKKIIKRSIYLFLMGLLLNAFPHHWDFSSLRILGVLQRIAICYFFSSLLFLTTSARTHVYIILSILIGYSLLMTHFSLSLENNLVGALDRLIFSPGHLYKPLFDPEGLLSTLPAIASALIGNLLGFWLISSRSNEQKCQGILIASCLLLFLGWIWQASFPLNKSLWSSSYVLWTGGWALMVFAFCFWCNDIKHWRHWSSPFSLFGKNAMLVYMLHILGLKIQSMIHIQQTNGELMTLKAYLTDLLFHPFSPQNASLFYALLYTLFWLFLLKISSHVIPQKNSSITTSCK